MSGIYVSGTSFCYIAKERKSAVSDLPHEYEDYDVRQQSKKFLE